MEAGVAVSSCGVIASQGHPLDGEGCVFLHDCVTDAIEKNHLRLLLFPSTASVLHSEGQSTKVIVIQHFLKFSGDDILNKGATDWEDTNKQFKGYFE